MQGCTFYYCQKAQMVKLTDTICKQPKHAYSAETIASNIDLLIGILLRVPIEALIRFKEVSQEWSSLISSPYFVSRYNLLHPPSLTGLILVPKHLNEDEKNRIEYISLGQNLSNAPALSFYLNNNIKLIQSCNGLLLYCKEGKYYYVLNPTTQEEKLLPSCPDSFTSRNPFYYSLAYDPSISPHYKIICVAETSKQGEYNIAVYSSESKVWRSCNNVQNFEAPCDIDFASATYCNGSVHWTKRTLRGLYFNVEEETVNLMPESPRQEQYSCEYFGQSQGYLHCVFTMEGLPYYELFEMEKDYSAWIFKCRIELDIEVHYERPRFMYQCDILSVFRGHNEDIREIIISIPGEVITYDCETKTSRTICKSRLRAKDKRIWYGIYHVYEYFEGLCRVSL